MFKPAIIIFRLQDTPVGIKQTMSHKDPCICLTSIHGRIGLLGLISEKLNERSLSKCTGFVIQDTGKVD